MIKSVDAKDIKEGYTLADLDYGFVFEVNDASGVAWSDGGYQISLPENLVLIGWHDQFGNENYMIVQPDHPLNVKVS